MKKGSICEGIVESGKYPDKGIVRTEDGILVVKNALPGQKVRCSVTKAGKDRMEGRLLEILERSPLETGKICK
ncbi:MAG: 23S rRNA (uracil-5-)-methyltransferase RumA, partial [Lachnospiraceae bacterium]|nr:23S rRNA (uracil-5-)-methyltransferase RumA [Lachnospiraceae bacterium]